MTTKKRSFSWMTALAAGVVLSWSPVAAEPIQPEQGFYAGLVLAQNPIGGDFNGSQILVAKGSNPQVLLVPDVEDKRAVGLALGARFARSALEFEYRQSEHVASFGPAKGTAEQTSFAMNWKFFFRPQARFQPTLLAGWIPYAPLEVRDAAATRRRVGNASFNTSIFGSYQYGFGATVLLHPRMSLSGTYTKRILRYSGAKGVGSSGGPIEDPLDASASEFVAGLGFTF